MTATDELRRLLDERGVEWEGTDFTKPTDGHPTNTSLDSENHDAVFIEYTDGSVLRQFDLTPEQAIAATLGNDGVERSKNGVAEHGTCRMERADWDDGTCTWGCICSACGKKFEHETGRGWHYCPKCGAEVVE